MKMKWQISFLVVSLAVMLLLTVPAFAQTTADVELVGVVEAMTLDTVTVNGLLVDVSTAEINTPIEVGALVRVEGSLNVDGTITARQINPVGDDIQPGEAELIGMVESFEDTTMVINGLSIDVTTAEIDPAIMVGEMVRVHATADSAGVWVAREVALFTPDPDAADDDPTPVGEFEITGTLEEIGDGFIVVAGQTITTTGAEIHDTLVVGVLVKAHVQLVDDVLVAREVENVVAGTGASANDNEDDDHNGNANDNDDADQNANDNSNDNDDDADQNANDNSNVDTSVSAQDAIDIVLAVYPNTTIVEIRLDRRFGDTLVWDIRTSHGLEITIDAQSGIILTIESHDDDVDNGNFNDNGNGGNTNTNSNDNSDDSGMGSNDNSDDSGMGSDDDSDDSGMGSDDD